MATPVNKNESKDSKEAATIQSIRSKGTALKGGKEQAEDNKAAEEKKK